MSECSAADYSPPVFSLAQRMSISHSLQALFHSTSFLLSSTSLSPKNNISYLKKIKGTINNNPMCLKGNAILDQEKRAGSFSAVEAFCQDNPLHFSQFFSAALITKRNDISFL